MIIVKLPIKFQYIYKIPELIEQIVHCSGTLLEILAKSSTAMQKLLLILIYFGLEFHKLFGIF